MGIAATIRELEEELKGETLADTVRRVLETNDSEYRKRIAEALVTKAADGNISAIRLVIELENALVASEQHEPVTW